MRRSIAGALLVAASLVPNSALAAGPASRPPPLATPNKVWLALGDSYSSGEGLANNDFAANPPGKNCERATGYTEDPDAEASRTYSRVAYDQLGGATAGWDYRLLACTGDRSQDVAGQLGEWSANDPRRADLVTISIGGNNIGFADVILGCTGLSQEAPYINKARPRCDVTGEQLNARIDALVTPSGQASDGGPNLFDLYTGMARDAVTSGGHIVVVGYPRPVADPSTWSWHQGGRCYRIQRDDVAMLRGVSDYFTNALRDLVSKLNALPTTARNGVTFDFVDVGALYEPPGAPGHGLCGPDPWLNGIVPGITGSREGDSKVRFQRSFHPNQHGHDGLGETVGTLVGGLDWSQLGVLPVDTPDCERIDDDLGRPAEVVDGLCLDGWAYVDGCPGCGGDTTFVVQFVGAAWTLVLPLPVPPDAPQCAADWAALGMPAPIVDRIIWPCPPPTTTTVPGASPVDAAVARFVEFMHAYGNGDLTTYCTIALPGLTRFFGPMTVDDCVGFIGGAITESPDELASIAGATVDASQATAVAPDRVEIPATAVSYPTPIDDPGDPGDLVVMGLIDGEWYVVDGV